MHHSARTHEVAPRDKYRFPVDERAPCIPSKVLSAISRSVELGRRSALEGWWNGWCLGNQTFVWVLPHYRLVVRRSMLGEKQKNPLISTMLIHNFRASLETTYIAKQCVPGAFTRKLSGCNVSEKASITPRCLERLWALRVQ